MDRRTFCILAGTSVASMATRLHGSSTLTAALKHAPPASRLPGGAPFKAKFAPHLDLLPTAPEGFVPQLQFAYDLGFRAWEENWLIREKPGVHEQVAEFCKDKGIELGVSVISSGQGVHFYAPGKEGTEKVLADMQKGVELAKRTGQTNMTMIPGPRDESKPREKQIAESVDLMRRCCDIIEEHGIIMALEPLSHGVTGGPPLLRSFADGHRLCSLVDRKSCKLLADFYHEAQIGNRDKLIASAERVWDQVTYVQYGASPGRKEPGTGECDYEALTQWLRDKGFTGIIGMEHGASESGEEGLEALIAAYRKIDA
ncbi:MAG: sugar phosphate isomerase/epimerase family protein [Planctomycetota bacterium]